MQLTHRLQLVALGTIAALALAGCGGGGAASGDEDGEVIRFAFAPDPVWDLMSDAGVIKEWEEENNVRIETSTTWDEFTYFAGGHGDIVSMATQETPVLEAETDIETVRNCRAERIIPIRNARFLSISATTSRATMVEAIVCTVPLKKAVL